MCGKGDKPRPCDEKKFRSNYEKIFGTEEEVRERRKFRIVQQKIGKVKLDPDRVVSNHQDVR